jgi:hypothetical protein
MTEQITLVGGHLGQAYSYPFDFVDRLAASPSWFLWTVSAIGMIALVVLVLGTIMMMKNRPYGTSFLHLGTAGRREAILKEAQLMLSLCVGGELPLRAAKRDVTRKQLISRTWYFKLRPWLARYGRSMSPGAARAQVVRIFDAIDGSLVWHFHTEQDHEAIAALARDLEQLMTLMKDDADRAR